jgi:hypothetical protein
MVSRVRISLIVVAAAVVGLSGQVGARQQRSESGRPAKPNFDIRAERMPARGSARALAELERAQANRRRGASRLHPHTGGIRVLDSPGWTTSYNAPTVTLRNLLLQSADRLGLDNQDLASLDVVRDYVSRSTGLRHVTFAQTLDGLPVFGAQVTLHIAASGDIVRVTSSAARGAGRQPHGAVAFPAEAAAMAAAADVSPETPFVPSRIDGGFGSNVARFARGRFRRDVSAALEWFAMDSGVRLAWHVELEPEDPSQSYDLMIDAQTGELLLRRNRVLDANGDGRVLQSNATQAIDARRPDPLPLGAGACPPPVNHELRDLTAPFRDPGTVLFNTGRLSGNNTHVFRGNAVTEGALGTFDGSRWLFDFPFNTAASAETALFFSVNFAHDFFYDLGFDEAAGNFQVDNFGRGGTGGDPIKAIARAAGRNNATFQPMPEGTSPIISMFLFDGLGCWASDVDGDGTLDLDGDYDNDIVLHEFHHGVSHRINTAFTGNEADAIGEGGSDFFAYSINGETTLAEYARPGGLRAVNGKTYANWTCLFFIFCEPHDNGEIWVNVMWDIRERFRADLVRGSEAAAINESHQLYIDGLKLSPPSPTMLDIRDAMLQADEIRNPGSPQSQNYCALWESFAGRGMGVFASDTAANGFNQVVADFSVPDGCEGPPPPPTITVVASVPTSTEAGQTAGAFTISRAEATTQAVTVSFTLSGTAFHGTDYATVPLTATIPSGALSVNVPVVPIDDALVENNETAVLTLRTGVGYVVGSPSIATVNVVSDDVAPDFTVTALTVPQVGGAGVALVVSDTTRNQGTGAAGATTTSFYLSANSALDASDTLVGTRDVPALGPGASSTAPSTSLMIPAMTSSASYWLFAKADGPGTVAEPNETNNTRSAIVRIGPDVVISTLTAPANVGAGVPFAVTETTKNQGGGSAGGSLTRFYLSNNFTFDAGDQELQTRTVNPLDAGASHLAITNVTLPAGTTGGLYYLFAVADVLNGVQESLETNNTRYFAIRVGADLQVSSLTAPIRVGVGATFAVNDTTRNLGGGDAGATTTAFYISSNITFDAGDYRLPITRPVGPLVPNGSSAGPTDVTLPAFATTGVWYVMARADDLDEVGESQEGNNVRYVAINVGPDLNVASVVAPASVVAGTSMTVTDTVRNLGADAAPPSTNRYYLSLNTVLDASDTPLDAQRDVPALAFNATNTGSTSVAIPAGLSGTRYLLVVADGTGLVVESSETNNVWARQVIINP